MLQREFVVSSYVLFIIPCCAEYNTHSTHVKAQLIFKLTRAVFDGRSLVYLVVSVGHAVAQLVEALRYKPEGRGFDSRWCHWNFSLT